MRRSSGQTRLRYSDLLRPGGRQVPPSLGLARAVGRSSRRAPRATASARGPSSTGQVTDRTALVETLRDNAESRESQRRGWCAGRTKFVYDRGRQDGGGRFHARRARQARGFTLMRGRRDGTLLLTTELKGTGQGTYTSGRRGAGRREHRTRAHPRRETGALGAGLRTSAEVRTRGRGSGPNLR